MHQICVYFNSVHRQLIIHSCIPCFLLFPKTHHFSYNVSLPKHACFLIDTKEDESDVDNGELIDFETFLTIVLEHMEKPLWIRNEAQEAFSIFDKDGNGFLDAVEMKRVLNKIGEELTDVEIEDQLRHYDIDGDFQMMASEFVKIVIEKF